MHSDEPPCGPSFFAKSRAGEGNGASARDREARAATLREAMVEQQLRPKGIRDERVLRAMAEVPRHAFVPPEIFESAYGDYPLPIGRGQTISQPYIVALLVEALGLTGDGRVLEVGAGSGYQAAVLAQLATHVYSIEYDGELAASARERMKRLGLEEKVTIIEGDGSVGYPPAAPYDGLIVAAAAPAIPECFFDQLAENGRLVIPVGERDLQELIQLRRTGGKPVRRNLGQCRFVPLLGENGWPEV